MPIKPILEAIFTKTKMLSPSRSSNSKSFLREAEYALMLIANEKARKYFLEKLQQVFEKRKDPKATLTGEKALKTEILAYLHQKGELKTANVWARNIILENESIDKLLALLQERLMSEDIEGVLELHLQDREINSPHIQFVGIKSERAEQIIANTLVELGYEQDLENALAKKMPFVPYYEENEKARTKDLKTELLHKQKIEEQYLEWDSIFKRAERILSRSRELLKKGKEQRIAMEERLRSLREFKQNLRSKGRKLRRLRKKRR